VEMYNGRRERKTKPNPHISLGKKVTAAVTSRHVTWIRRHSITSTSKSTTAQNVQKIIKMTSPDWPQQVRLHRLDNLD
jgi:hypothetical protein